MAARQEDIERVDLKSTVGLMPAFEPIEQRTDNSLIIQNEDGSIDVIPLSELNENESDVQVHHDKVTDPGEWNENMAAALSRQERMTLADRLTEYLDIDEQARSDHFTRMKDAITLLGITAPGEGGDAAPFPGAASVTHPMIAEAITQFQARAIEELLPANGPVKSTIMGKGDRERRQQAERVADYMNYQFTEQDTEHFWNTDQMLFYLGMSGTAFKKAMPDPITGMIVSRFVKDVDFIVPYNAKSLESAPRYCHRYRMWENDIRRAMARGEFLESAELPTPGAAAAIDDKVASEFEDKGDDRTPTMHYDDNFTEMLEYHIDIRLKWDDPDAIAPPYIITVDTVTREILAIRRNWRMEDETRRKRIWFAMYKYLPGVGFYGMGMLHIVGNLAIAASGAMRALLDAAAFANFQGGFKAKGTNMGGEIRLQPGVYKDIDATIEDLAKMFYTPPFKEPSPALANMLQLMVEEGRRYLTTTENMVGDASNTGPVGTTLALIEQGSKVFSAIHKRMHVSARAEYRMIAELNFEFMPVEEYPYDVNGSDRTVLRQDFDGRVDIIPVSDPNIWSSTQRIAQAQATVELMSSDPELYPAKARRVAHRRLLEALKVPEVDEILPDKNDRREDPVTENMNIMTGRPAKAFYEQDHAAHIAVHTNFATKMAATNPDLVAELEPVMKAHIMEHTAFQYRQEVEADLGITLPPFEFYGDEVDEDEIPPEVEQQISQAVAARMRPPPKPQPQEDPAAAQAAAEAKAAEDAADAEVIAKMEREAAVTGQRLAHDEKAFKAEESRKDRAFQAEQRRQEAAFQGEQQRGAAQAVGETRAAMLSRLSKRKDGEAKDEGKGKGKGPKSIVRRPGGAKK